MVARFLRSAAIVCLTSFLGLSPLHSSSQEYAFIPKTPTEYSNPKLKEEQKPVPTPKKDESAPVDLRLQYNQNPIYVFPPQEKDQYALFAKRGALRIEQILEEKFSSDLSLKVNMYHGSEYAWQNDYITQKGKDIIKDGFEDAFKKTPLYKNFQNFVESRILEPYVEPITRNIAKEILDVFVSRERARRWSDKINISLNLDLGTDEFKDPFIEIYDRPSMIDFTPTSLRFDNDNGIIAKIKPDGFDLRYEEITSRNTRAFIGVSIKGYSFHLGNQKLDFDQAGWKAYAGFRGRIFRDVNVELYAQTKGLFKENDDPYSNETSVLFALGKRF